MKKKGELKDVSIKTCYVPFVKRYVDFKYDHNYAM